jgi:hypothetical protein
LQNRHEGEWEPGGALREALEGLPLRPGTGRDAHLAGLGPHLEEALGELGRLERQRGLSDGERVVEEALRVLLAAARGPGRRPRAGTPAREDVPPGTRSIGATPLPWEGCFREGG